ncbi:major facilitator superfamily transporter [Sporothrix brasiliensis 5110]|uniref:Major facilitator superfamily transporter n=1 Tax=Sporothrix brasiliensis 5110 TaxID=1398154 RepID=A0A0C2IHV3_9PEZI|nr:major facilitator superfamily transporter [Sporothrix brasiliensis 5110]KIH86560.1 major facilitator superfamily transporter [Sporothrix brasiliensis 5110]
MLSLVQIESSASTGQPGRTEHAAHSTSTSVQMASASGTHYSASPSIPARPARAVARPRPASPLAANDDNVLLERKPSTKTFDAADLERSRPVTPVENDDENSGTSGANVHHADTASHHTGLGSEPGDDAENGVEVLQSIFLPRKNIFRMATAALNAFNDGLNDSAAGALLPYIERHYNIGYGVVSLIFVACAFGSIIAATVADPMKRRLGQARTLCIGQLIMAVGYVPLLTTVAPFVAVVVGFFAVGLGEALNVAMGNTYCAGIQQGTLALGIVHGSYGIGGISGPLIATAMAVATGAAEDPDSKSAIAFGRFYLVPFGVCVLTSVLSAWTFAGYERDWGEVREATPDSSSSEGAAERRRRWLVGRQRQAALDNLQQQQEQEQAGQDRPERAARQVPWDAKGKTAMAAIAPPSPPPANIELTDFASNASAIQRPQPTSTHATAAPPRVRSRSTSPVREFASPQPPRPSLSPIQSHPQTISPFCPSASASVVATPSHSFASSTAPLFPAGPAAPSTAAPTTTQELPQTPTTMRLRTQHATTRLKDMFTVPSSRMVLLGALFLFMYQGAEVSVAGWVTSFLIANRGGTEPKVGYITAGFWAGITVGRFVLAVPAQRIGPRRAVYLLVVGSAVFELLVWFVPNVIGDAVAVSAVGLLLGPVYPCAVGLMMRNLSRRERVAGISVMGAFGSAGGAAAPFITGVLAQAVGTFVLHPIVICLFTAMLVFWYLVPDLSKQKD